MPYPKRLVVCTGLAPTYGRWSAVEGLILLGAEEVEHSTGHTVDRGEVADGRRVDVNAADAAIGC